MTSLTGESVRIYPMPVWQAVERKLGQMPSTHPARLRFLDRVNYYGQVGEIDAQGRVADSAAPARVGVDDGRSGCARASTTTSKSGTTSAFNAKLLREPFTDDDARALAEFGI